MTGIQTILFGVLFGSALAGIAYLMVVPLLRLLPGHWLESVHWPLVIIAGFLGILVAVDGITYGLAVSNFRYTLGPGPHACGGPYVDGAGPCETALWDKWLSENKIDVESYKAWLRTPPSLRPTCEAVAGRLCGIIAENPLLTSWETYIGLLVAIFEVGLACALMIHWIWQRAIQRHQAIAMWAKVSDLVLPLMTD